MAISIVQNLKLHGYVDQDALAKRFARRFEREPDRGYGKMTRIQLREINAGAKWRDMAANAFGGQGSMGNGGAMRVAPLGAYFADDLERCAEEARQLRCVGGIRLANRDRRHGAEGVGADGALHHELSHGFAP